MKNKLKTFHRDILQLQNINNEMDMIVEKLRFDVQKKLNRRGAVVGISGGIDSSVSLALAVRAFGKERVLGVMLPEKDSDSDSEKYARKLAEKFNVDTIVENITTALEGFQCYRRRDDAVKKVFPEYNPENYKMKIGIKTSGLFTNLPPVFSLIIVDRYGNESSSRLSPEDFRQIEAASNFKQRCRMSVLYYYAEKLHFAVIGTPNKHELDQGFFVKYGDGGSDIMPIAHLYKTQVYQMASALEIPEEIILRTPTTDTYSAQQTQEEFFYQMPFDQMDLLWYGFENGYLVESVAKAMKMSTEQVKSIFMNFERKQRTTEYLRMQPIRYRL